MAKPIFQTLLVLLAIMAHLATAFSPPGEWGQTAVLIQDIIYVYGGAQTAVIGITNMYTLNVSQSWNTTAPAWTDHSSDGGNFTRPQVAFHNMWPSDDEESFYVWGGGNIISIKPTLSGFAQYNIANQTWSLPSDSAAVNVPPPRRETVASWSSSGVAYIWGGYGDVNTGYTLNGTVATIIFNEIISFDSVNLVWSVLKISGVVPLPRIEHTGTMLPNNQIVMIGGLNGTQVNGTYVRLQYVSLTDIPVFDTNYGTWKLINATGTAPASRRLHAAVLGEDGYSIIICCGGTHSQSVNLNDVAVLDTKSWNWTQPLVSGTPPAARFAPSSIMVNGQMVVFFGWSNFSTGLNDVAVLDTRTSPYHWATIFNSTKDAEKRHSTKDDKQRNSTKEDKEPHSTKDDKEHHSTKDDKEHHSTKDDKERHSTKDDKERHSTKDDKEHHSTKGHSHSTKGHSHSTKDHRERNSTIDDEECYSTVVDIVIW